MAHPSNDIMTRSSVSSKLEDGLESVRSLRIEMLSGHLCQWLHHGCGSGVIAWHYSVLVLDFLKEAIASWLYQIAKSVLISLPSVKHQQFHATLLIWKGPN